MLTDQQLKVKRDVERTNAIAKGLIDDPNKPRSLSEAIHFQGTCLDMCPEFEMHQREFQNNVEKFEIVMISLEELKLISRILQRAA
jgi:nuclear mRNA export protein SAC3